MGADADLIRRLTSEGFVAGDRAVVDELFSDDLVDHDPPPGMPATKESQLAIVDLMSTAFSDVVLEFDDVMETTDGRVVESWAMNGVHSGEAFGLPASGQRARVRGVEIFRIADGKIVEHWGAVDMSDFIEKAMGAGG